MESYQAERIKIMKEILPLFGKDFVLKGGTALSLYYGLDRFSEDIDLDCKAEEMNFLEKFKPFEDRWKITVRKDTPTVFRVMLDYGGENHFGSYPLKIEVSSRNKNLLNNDILKYRTVQGVNVYEVQEIIAMKTSTFSQRDKIRDLYDLGFLLRRYPEKFTKEQLISIYQNMGYKGLDDLALLLDEEMKGHRLKIMDAESYVLDLYERCESYILQQHSSLQEKSFSLEAEEWER